MVIDDSYICGSAVCPLKNNAPLVVDEDRVETGKVSFQQLESISGRNT